MEKKNHVHILYVLTKLELGGAQKVCLTLMKGIEEKEHSSSLISGTQGVLVEQAQQHKSVLLLKNFKREVGIFSLLHELIAFIQMIFHMKKLKKQYCSIIVHTHSTKAGIMGRWAAFFAGIKKRVHTVHGFGFHDHQSKLVWAIHVMIEYLTSFVTSHYICVSRADQKTGIRLFPRFAQKSSIIRAAVDWNNFYQPSKEEQLTVGAVKTTPSKSEEKFIFGTVSCLKPQKNILDLLKAFKHMHNLLPKDLQNKVLLQIIGDGVHRELVEEWVITNGMFHHIDLLGWQHNVSAWMHSWHAFVLSSLWEGLPCAIVEARLSRLPVISYAIAGIPEVVTDGQNGFLVQPGNWKELGEKMKLFVTNRALHETMSHYNDNLTDFCDNVMIEKHLQLYKTLL